MTGRFFDTYSRFYQTTGTNLLPNRLHQRYKAIIGANARIFEGARVLDLASHDGRWSFAALMAGAANVTGVEAREELVKRAQDTFVYYRIDPKVHELICGDAEEYLANLVPGEFDVILCLGYFYHTMHHMRLLELISRTGANFVIIDTAVAPTDEAVIAINIENVDDFRNSVDYANVGSKEIPVGAPSPKALLIMLEYLKFECSEVDWFVLCDDWAECHDYQTRHRRTFVVRRV